MQVSGKPGPPQYLIYRIQAKILKRITTGPPHVAFSSLGQGGGKQMFDLISNSEKVGAYPFYCFYIGDPWPIEAPIKLPQWSGVSARGMKREQFGATAIPALTVQQTYSSNRNAANANLYLTAPPVDRNWYFDLSCGGGRRLSDLFPDQGGWGPAGHGPVGRDYERPFPELLTDLTRPEQEAYRREVERVRAAEKTGAAIPRDSFDETPGRPKLTFYMLLRE